MTGDIFTENDVLLGTIKDIKIELDKFTFDWGEINQKIDHTIFGLTNKTFTIDLPKLPEKTREVRIVSPEKVGIFLPGVKSLGLNGCITGETFNFDSLWGGILGHAHITPGLEDYGRICTNEEWLKNSDGTYSNILLHEVAHICTDYSKYFNKKDKNLNYWHHGIEWQKWARKLGVADTGYEVSLPY